MTSSWWRSDQEGVDTESVQKVLGEESVADAADGQVLGVEELNSEAK